MHSKERILELHNRNKIYEFILKYPGIHQRQIIQKIDLSEGTIKYHLDFLTKKGYIDRKNMLGYTRFYPSKKIGIAEKEILSLMRQEVPRQILIFLLYNFGASQAQLSKELKKDTKTIDHHLKKLLKMEFITHAVFKDGVMITNRYETKTVERTPIGKEKVYQLKHAYLIYYFLVKYKDCFLDDEITKDTIDALVFISKGVQPKNFDSDEKVIDRTIKVFFDIFPFPWCA